MNASSPVAISIIPGRVDPHDFSVDVTVCLEEDALDAAQLLDELKHGEDEAGADDEDVVPVSEADIKAAADLLHAKSASALEEFIAALEDEDPDDNEPHADADDLVVEAALNLDAAGHCDGDDQDGPDPAHVAHVVKWA